MAWLLGDGFDFYNTAADASGNTAIWSNVNHCTLSLNSGRFGGNSMLVGDGGINVPDITTAAFTNSNVIYVNLNLLDSQTHVNGGTSVVQGFSWLDGSTKQGGLFLRNGGDFIVTNGASGGTILGTSTVLYPFISQWMHIQVKIVVHATAGSIEIRINGSPTADYLLTGINTRNGTGNVYANAIIHTATVPGGGVTNHCLIDDFYVFNDQGIQPNTWQGDVHAIQQFPFTDTAISWTRNTGTFNFQAVDEPHQDGDTTYVATNVVNNTDVYALAPLSPTPTTVVAVCTRYMARMDDAGPHTVNASLTSGGTTDNLPNYVCTTSYAYQQKVYPQDPNTSAAWTAAAVNALQLSIKDIV